MAMPMGGRAERFWFGTCAYGPLPDNSEFGSPEKLGHINSLRCRVARCPAPVPPRGSSKALDPERKSQAPLAPRGASSIYGKVLASQLSPVTGGVVLPRVCGYGSVLRA